jgi:hypothetical protein
LRHLIAFGLLALAACDDVAGDPGLEGNLAATAAYFAGAWGGPEYDAVAERTHDVLVNGGVTAELDCRNLTALSATPGKLVIVKHYKASKLQDGACNAKVDQFFPLTGVTGLAQASASELTRRTDPEADECPVTSFGPAGVGLLTWVEAGVLRVEGPGCTTTPGTTCSAAITAAQCSGDLDQF